VAGSAVVGVVIRVRLPAPSSVTQPCSALPNLSTAAGRAASPCLSHHTLRGRSRAPWLSRSPTNPSSLHGLTSAPCGVGSVQWKAQPCRKRALKRRYSALRQLQDKLSGDASGRSRPPSCCNHRSRRYPRIQ
jgi:hypothetical protein